MVEGPAGGVEVFRDGATAEHPARTKIGTNPTTARIVKAALFVFIASSSAFGDVTDRQSRALR